ncbi:phage tail protein [Pseudomonas sp. BNK-43-a]|uniref:phage tail protein n=1 Tax=unclassified Pseudomonas TaxID=196821 RepID=UPI0039BFA881
MSITAGQTTVTGTGTNFSLNARVGDAFQGPDGRWYEVANIGSATVIGILPAYQGATVAAGAYGLAPMQGYVKEAADRLRQIVDQFGGTLALFGGATDVVALRTNIGAAKSGTNSDITSLSGLTTALSIAQGGTGATTKAGARTALDLKAAALADILGTVSQASGYPTGAVMEWGFNANGEYYKFASGLMICTATKTVTVALSTSYGSSSFGAANWDFPATFVGTLPFVSGKAFATGRILTVEPAAAQQLYSSALWVLDFATNGTSMGVLLKMFAVGRWF